MHPSDEVSDFELTVRVRTLRANLECGRAGIELAVYNATIALDRLGRVFAGVLLRWELEQRDAWIIAQRDPEAWLNRLVRG